MNYFDDFDEQEERETMARLFNRWIAEQKDKAIQIRKIREIMNGQNPQYEFIKNSS